MSPTLLFTFIIGYFLVLLAVAWFTSRGSNNESFFIGNRKSNWMLVAFGMIGTSLSGVTFVSVPGGVGSGNFYYFQVVIGLFVWLYRDRLYTASLVLPDESHKYLHLP
jgi:Na+/proline symporter